MLAEEKQKTQRETQIKLEEEKMELKVEFDSRVMEEDEKLRRWRPGESTRRLEAESLLDRQNKLLAEQKIRMQGLENSRREALAKSGASSAEAQAEFDRLKAGYDKELQEERQKLAAGGGTDEDPQRSYYRE